jgi:hypothetical protein
MIPLNVTAGPPKAGLARTVDAEAPEQGAEFADVMDVTADDPAEVDAAALPPGLVCIVLPNAPKADPQPDKVDTAPPIQTDVAPRPMLAGPPDRLEIPLTAPEMAELPSPAQPVQKPQATEIKPQVALLDDAAPAIPPTAAAQGPAEIAMRAALQPDAPPEVETPVATDQPDLPTISDQADTQPTATAPDVPQRLAEPSQPRSVAAAAFHPAEVVAQILPKAMVQDGEVELLLAPEELGKLRFVIQHDGASVKILMAAERPETLDLLRRHADQLVQEFRQSGYSGATIDFGSWTRQGQQRQAPQLFLPEESTATVTLPAIPANPPPLSPSTQGLNLRL